MCNAVHPERPPRSGPPARQRPDKTRLLETIGVDVLMLDDLEVERDRLAHFRRSQLLTTIDTGSGDRDERIARFVGARLRLHELRSPGVTSY